MKNEQNQQPPAQLNPESFNAIAAAFSRLSMLSGKSIDAGPNDNTQAEKEQLIEFLATQFLQHAGEFIACYNLVHREYLPALNALRNVATRAGLFSPQNVKVQPPASRLENN